MKATTRSEGPSTPAGRRSQVRWYQLVYRFLYRSRLIIWQRPKPPSDLVKLVEGPAALPAGRALDLGCGTGTDTIYLASHGWQVTGVDLVPRALAIAERRAKTAGVSARFVAGDVTQLPALGIGDGYQLILDFGCFHTLPEDQRPAYVASVTGTAAADATLLLYGFRHPPKAAPMHAGVSTEEVRDRFHAAGWKLDHADHVAATDLGIGVPRSDKMFELWRFRLHLTASG